MSISRCAECRERIPSCLSNSDHGSNTECPICVYIHKGCKSPIVAHPSSEGGQMRQGKVIAMCPTERMRATPGGKDENTERARAKGSSAPPQGQGACAAAMACTTTQGLQPLRPRATAPSPTPQPPKSQPTQPTQAIYATRQIYIYTYILQNMSVQTGSFSLSQTNGRRGFACHKCHGSKQIHKTKQR